MKILVNQSAADLEQKKYVDKVLNLAKQEAAKGHKTFVFRWPENLNRSGWKGYFCDKVKEASEGTVVCAYRGNYGTHIKFVIVEWTKRKIFE